MSGNRIFTMDIDVRFRDLDARGHVNNAVYFTYFEQGRMRFYNSVLHKNTLSEITFILARTSCNFVRPITLNDRPLSQLWVKEIGSKSVAFEYQLVSSSKAAIIYATGESVQVCFDYQNNASMPISKEIRAQFSKYLKNENSRSKLERAKSGS
jgi:acyl-CoA thioester hydrolase